MRLCCVTLNLEGMKHDWTGRREAQAIAGLRALQPDVLCLQETTVVALAPPYDQAAALGNALGLPNVAFAPYGNPAETMSHDQGGIAIVSRWPFCAVRNRRLPSTHTPTSDARVAQLVTLATPEGRVNVLNTHLSWRPEEAEVRIVQGSILCAEIASLGWLEPEARTLLAGDLNAVDSEPVIQGIGEALMDAWRSRHPEEPGYTWCHKNPFTTQWQHPDRRLDYIFASRSAQVLRAEVVLTEANPVPVSDHYGVLVEVEWGAGTSTPRSRLNTPAKRSTAT